MRFKRTLVALVVALPTILIAAAPASAGCNDAPVPRLYKKLTGEDMFECPF